MKNNFLNLSLIVNYSMIFFYIFFLYKYHYLPYPFLPDANDTFMDLYNPMWWVSNGGFYEEWRSVYPPLNFLILEFFNLFNFSSYYSSAYDLRESSFAHLIYIFIYFLFSYYLAFNKLCHIFSKSNKIKIFFLIISLSPMIFMLERANLIIFCLIPILVILNCKNNLIRSIMISFLINLKPYFIIYLLYYVAIRRIKYFFITIFLTLFLFIFFGLLYDENFVLIFQNFIYFSSNINTASPRELITYPSSVAVYYDLFKSGSVIQNAIDTFGGYYFLLNNLVSLGYFTRYLLLFISIILIFLIGVKERDEIIFLLLTIMITHIGTSVGGYSLSLYIPFIPLFFRLGRISFLYYLLFALILFNYDFFTIMFRYGFPTTSYFFGDYLISHDWKLGISSIFRPLANSFLFSLFIIHIFRRNYLKKINSE